MILNNIGDQTLLNIIYLQQAGFRETESGSYRKTYLDGCVTEVFPEGYAFFTDANGETRRGTFRAEVFPRWSD